GGGRIVAAKGVFRRIDARKRVGARKWVAAGRRHRARKLLPASSLRIEEADHLPGAVVWFEITASSLASLLTAGAHRLRTHHAPGQGTVVAPILGELRTRRASSRGASRRLCLLSVRQILVDLVEIARRRIFRIGFFLRLFLFLPPLLIE